MLGLKNCCYETFKGTTEGLCLKETSIVMLKLYGMKNENKWKEQTQIFPAEFILSYFSINYITRDNVGGNLEKF